MGGAIKFFVLQNVHKIHSMSGKPVAFYAEILETSVDIANMRKIVELNHKSDQYDIIYS